MCRCVTELWLPVAGYEGYYEVSTCGRCRSLDRFVPHGRGGGYRKIKGRVLSLVVDYYGYQYVNLYQNGPHHRKVHHLVLETFVGPRLPGAEGCHWDGNPTNNHVSNLRWGTSSENNLDKIRHGTHHHARKTHCPLNHRLVAPNLVTSKKFEQWRECLACNQARSSQRHAHTAGQQFDFRADADARYTRIMSDTEVISAAARTHCPLNHPLVSPNLVASKWDIGHRQCLACTRAHANRQHARKHDRSLDFRTAANAHYARIMAKPA
jgi:hypothetical protein